MEARNAPVMGYPPEDHNAPVMGYPAAAAAAAATTNTNNNTLYPVQVPPTGYNHPRTSDLPPPQDKKVNKWQRTTVAIVVILVVASFFIFPILTPLPPKMRVESVSVSSFNVSALHEVSANWNIRFHLDIVNENNYYKEAQVSVFYKEVKLSSMPILVSYYFNIRHFLMVSKTNYPSSSVSLTEWAAKDIEFDRSNGIVNFTMIIDGFFRVSKWFARYKMMMFICEDVKVGFSHNPTAGTMLGKHRKCKVHPKRD